MIVKKNNIINNHTCLTWCHWTLPLLKPTYPIPYLELLLIVLLRKQIANILLNKKYTNT